MYDLEKYYTKDYYNQQLKWKTVEYPKMMNIIVKNLRPRIIFDFGAGNGILALGLNPRVVYIGLEGSMAGYNQSKVLLEEHNHKVFLKDLREEVTMFKNAEKYRDRVIGVSVECLEHIEEEYARTVVQNMVKLSDTWVVTAAPPGQQGTQHVNCQPKEYWEGLFKEQGYRRDLYREEKIQDELNVVLPTVRQYLSRNLIVFRK